MSVYQQIAWLPLCGGLTAVGLIASWFAWRRRGAAAGLRGAAWSLLPLAAYLVGVIELLWRFGVAIGQFAVSFVFSPVVWSGIIVVAVSALLFAVSTGLRRRGRGASNRAGGGTRDGGRAAPAPKPGASVAPAKGARRSGDDDDLGDVADILRKHNIR